jgi:hypothetical protein
MDLRSLGYADGHCAAPTSVRNPNIIPQPGAQREKQMGGTLVYSFFFTNIAPQRKTKLHMLVSMHPAKVIRGHSKRAHIYLLTSRSPRISWSADEPTDQSGGLDVLSASAYAKLALRNSMFLAKSRVYHTFRPYTLLLPPNSSTIQAADLVTPGSSAKHSIRLCPAVFNRILFCPRRTPLLLSLGGSLAGSILSPGPDS